MMPSQFRAVWVTAATDGRAVRVEIMFVSFACKPYVEMLDDTDPQCISTPLSFRQYQRTATIQP
jgi:hypothetical protein